MSILDWVLLQHYSLFENETDFVWEYYSYPNGGWFHIWIWSEEAAEQNWLNTRLAFGFKYDPERERERKRERTQVKVEFLFKSGDERGGDGTELEKRKLLDKSIVLESRILILKNCLSLHLNSIKRQTNSALLNTLHSTHTQTFADVTNDPFSLLTLISEFFK